MKNHYKIIAWKWNKKEYEPTLLLDSRFSEGGISKEEMMKSFNKTKLSMDIARIELIEYVTEQCQGIDIPTGEEELIVEKDF